MKYYLKTEYDLICLPKENIQKLSSKRVFCWDESFETVNPFSNMEENILYVDYRDYADNEEENFMKYETMLDDEHWIFDSEDGYAREVCLIKYREIDENAYSSYGKTIKDYNSVC